MSVHAFPNNKAQQTNPPNGGGGDDMELTERVSKIEAMLQNLATKIDLSELRIANKNDLADLRIANKADVSNLRTEMHKEFTSQTWRIITFVTGLFLTVGSGLVAATYFIAKHIT